MLSQMLQRLAHKAQLVYKQSASDIRGVWFL